MSTPILSRLSGSEHMESWTGYVLKHKQTGLYWSKMADHTTKLRQAKRFYDADEANVYMEVSHYKPDRPDEYELQEVELTMKEREKDVQQKR